MNPVVSKHSWSKEALLQKAKLYIGEMEKYSADDWQFGFWSSLVIEHLSRASVAHVSPVFLAEARNLQNLLYALEIDEFPSQSSPKSITNTELLNRVKIFCKDFNNHAGFCRQLLEKRNTELHSGELAFANFSASEWLPKFYAASETLLQSMDKELEDLFLEPDRVRKLIKELKSSDASKVKNNIKKHRLVWNEKDELEREELTNRARIWANRDKGHRVKCPSCKSVALVRGIPSGKGETTIDGDLILHKQPILPSSFKCIACELQIAGPSNLSTCGLGNSFTGSYTYTAAEYFGLFTEDDLEEARHEMPEYWDDFNE